VTVEDYRAARRACEHGGSPGEGRGSAARWKALLALAQIETRPRPFWARTSRRSTSGRSRRR